MHFYIQILSIRVSQVKYFLLIYKYAINVQGVDVECNISSYNIIRKYGEIIYFFCYYKLVKFFLYYIHNHTNRNTLKNFFK